MISVKHKKTRGLYKKDEPFAHSLNSTPLSPTTNQHSKYVLLPKRHDILQHTHHGRDPVLIVILSFENVLNHQTTSRMLFTHSLAFVAGVAAMTMNSVAACRPSTFSLLFFYNQEVAGDLTIRDFYSGSTPIGRVNEKVCSNDAEFCFKVDADEENNRWYSVRLYYGHKEYDLYKYNEKHQDLQYDYWHCL